MRHLNFNNQFYQVILSILSSNFINFNNSSALSKYRKYRHNYSINQNIGARHIQSTTNEMINWTDKRKIIKKLRYPIDQNTKHRNSMEANGEISFSYV